MKTLYELVTFRNNRVVYIEDITELDDTDMVAQVKVLYNEKTRKVVSRDQFVRDEDWMKFSEYKAKYWAKH